jgi:hypothetical protein
MAYRASASASPPSAHGSRSDRTKGRLRGARRYSEPPRSHVEVQTSEPVCRAALRPSVPRRSRPHHISFARDATAPRRSSRRCRESPKVTGWLRVARSLATRKAAASTRWWVRRSLVRSRITSKLCADLRFATLSTSVGGRIRSCRNDHFRLPARGSPPTRRCGEPRRLNSGQPLGQLLDS